MIDSVNKIYAVIEYGGVYSDAWSSVVFTTFDEQKCIDYINEKRKEDQLKMEHYEKDSELWDKLFEMYEDFDAIDVDEEFYNIKGYYYKYMYEYIDYRIDEYTFIPS